MLRCYTLGRADKAAIDEVLAVEKPVLVVRPSALSNLSKPRRRSVSPVQSTDLGKVGENHWAAVCDHRGDNVRIISVWRARKQEIDHYESN